MSLHRDLVLGNGFFNTLRPTAGAAVQQHAQLTTAFSLPVVNLFQVSQQLGSALMEEILPGDRKRLHAYLSRAPLGFGIITGGPGFGKTAVLSVATLGMSAALGPIYATAATDVAADNFAEHLNRCSERVTSRPNNGKSSTESLFGRILVMRGYYMGDELTAFDNLLQDPSAGDAAAPHSTWVSKTS
ncbi:hypothetical protein V8C42DRAFT_359097 [Trichoderma barbatum]